MESINHSHYIAADLKFGASWEKELHTVDTDGLPSMPHMTSVAAKVTPVYKPVCSEADLKQWADMRGQHELTPLLTVALGWQYSVDSNPVCQ